MGAEEPIHASSAQDELLRLRKSHANKKISIILAPRVINKNNQYEQERTKFDQMRPIPASVTDIEDHPTVMTTAPTKDIKSPLIINESLLLTSDETELQDHIIDPSGSITPTISIFFHSSVQPTLTNNIHDCFAYDNLHKSFWIQSFYEQYDKNASYQVFTKPFKKHLIHNNTLILKSVLAPTVKQTDKSSMWKLNVRHFVNGKPMKGITSYGETRTSTVGPDTVRFQIAYVTSTGFIH